MMMLKLEQKKLVKEICKNLAQSVIDDIEKGKIPENMNCM